MELNWIEWNGGECPVPHGHDVSVRLNNGSTIRGKFPEIWCWSQHEAMIEIVGYYDHTAAEQEEPREPKEWKDGLPPVGSVVCGQFLNWNRTEVWEITYMGDGVGCYKKEGKEFSFSFNSVVLSPIKSQAEKEREEARQIEIDMFNAMLEQEDIYLHSPDSENDRANMEFVIGEYLLKRLADKGE